MGKVFCVIALLSSTVFAQTYSRDVLPSTTGYKLGSTSQRWDAFIRNLNVAGPVTLTDPAAFFGTASGYKVNGTTVIDKNRNATFIGVSATSVNASSVSADTAILKGPIVDVRYFGATGTGTMIGTTITGTDDTTAIQTAVNYAAANGMKLYLPSPGAGKCYRITHLYLDNYGGRNSGWPSQQVSFEMFGDGVDSQWNIEQREFQRTMLCSTDTANPAIQVSSLSYAPAGIYPYRAYNLHDFNVIQSTSVASVPVIGINQLTENAIVSRIRVHQMGAGSGLVWVNLWSNSGVRDSVFLSEQSTPSIGSRGLWLFNADASAMGGGQIIADGNSTVRFDRNTQMGVVNQATTLFPVPDKYPGTNTTITTAQLIGNLSLYRTDSEAGNYAYVFAAGNQGTHVDLHHAEGNKIAGIVVTSGAANVKVENGNTCDSALTDAEFIIEATGYSSATLDHNYFQCVKTASVRAENLALNVFNMRNNAFKSEGATTCVNAVAAATSTEDGDMCSGFTTDFTDTTNWRSFSPYNADFRVRGKFGVGVTPKVMLQTQSESTNSMTLGQATGIALGMSDPTGVYGLFGGVSGSGYSWLQGGRVDGTATAYDLHLQDSGGNVVIGGGASVIYRCTTAGTLPIGALTTATGNCGASTDSGLRVK